MRNFCLKQTCLHDWDRLCIITTSALQLVPGGKICKVGQKLALCLFTSNASLLSLRARRSDSALDAVEPHETNL